MLTAIDQVKAPQERHLLPETVRVWATETLGVVASTVTLPVEGETRAFANVKVFTRSVAGDRRCVYWQVSPKLLP